MKTITVEILAPMSEYKRLLTYVTNKLFTNFDEFILNKFNNIILEEVFNYTIEPSTKLMVELMLNEIVVKLENRLYAETEIIKYTYDIDMFEKNISYIIILLTNKIDDDIKFKIRQLLFLNNQFHNYPKIKLLNNYNAVLKYKLKVENERNNDRR